MLAQTMHDPSGVCMGDLCLTNRALVVLVVGTVAFIGFWIYLAINRATGRHKPSVRAWYDDEAGTGGVEVFCTCGFYERVDGGSESQGRTIAERHKTAAEAPQSLDSESSNDGGLAPEPEGPAQHQTESPPPVVVPPPTEVVHRTTVRTPPGSEDKVELTCTCGYHGQGLTPSLAKFIADRHEGRRA